MKLFPVSFLVAGCVVLAQTAPPLTIPQIVNGRGWRTEIVLQNPGDRPITGKIQFFSSSGVPGRPISSYKLPAKASTRVQASAFGMKEETGSLRIVPDAGSAAPSGSALLFRAEKDKSVQQSTIQAQSGGGRSFRLFGEVIGKVSHVANSVRTGVAIANPGPAAATIVVEFKPGLSTSFVIPRNGQISAFIDELPGMPSKLVAPFSGMIRITSSADVSVAALRGRWESPDEFRTTSIAVEK